jgi:hypothetical protein
MTDLDLTRLTVRGLRLLLQERGYKHVVHLIRALTKVADAAQRAVYCGVENSSDWAAHETLSKALDELNQLRTQTEDSVEDPSK